MPSLGTSFSILLLLVCTPTAFGLISAPSLPSRGSRPFASVSSKHGLLHRGALSSPRARGARQRAALLRSHAIRRSSAVVATAEKAAARQDQAGKFCTGDGPWYGGKCVVKLPGPPIPTASS